jgi:MscS family membrane protein
MQHPLSDWMPSWLFGAGPYGLAFWQWLGLALAIFTATVLGAVISRLAGWGLGRVVGRTANGWDDALVEQSRGPLTAGLSVAAFFSLSPWLDLPPEAELLIGRMSRLVFLAAAFWFGIRALQVAFRALGRSEWARTHPASRSLLPLGGRAASVFAVAIAVVALLSEMGYPVASLVAGLGIGGIAVALAAQKTVENLFGSFSIGLDQPFREGDFVRLDDFVGTVESIGLRSTRFRTLDRTLITIPNGRLSDMKLESFSARDRMRFACTVGLVYSTTPAQVRQVLAGLEQLLRAHPKIWPDAVVVRFQALASYSLDIEVMAWFQTPDWGEFQLIRQEVLLGFMEVIERAGSSFAFPTQTVVLSESSRTRPDAAPRGAPTNGATPDGQEQVGSATTLEG